MDHPIENPMDYRINFREGEPEDYSEDYSEDYPISVSDGEVALLDPLFPTSRGVLGVDDRRVSSAVKHVTAAGGCHRRDLPVVHGLHPTAYSRFKRWSRKRIFHRMLRGLPRAWEEIMKQVDLAERVEQTEQTEY